MPKKVRDGEGNLITERRKNNNGYKFTWAAIVFLGLLFTAVTGWFFVTKGQAENRMTKIEDTNSEIRIMISEMARDICWIKDTLKEMRRR